MGINSITEKEWDMMNTSYLGSKQQGILSKQVGGNHYKGFAIQPAEFCHKNKIGYLEATAIKYLCRWRDKNGIEDLDKAIHFIEMLKEFECKP
jgi:hypothetical protein